MASLLKRGHTVLLVQDTRKQNSFQSFPKFQLAMEAIINMYEAALKQMNPHLEHISYDISDLNGFIDEKEDLTAMVLDERTFQYDGVSRTDLKNAILAMLQRQAQGA